MANVKYVCTAKGRGSMHTDVPHPEVPIRTRLQCTVHARHNFSNTNSLVGSIIHNVISFIPQFLIVPVDRDSS